jgi:hypothetical protein
MYLSRGPNTPNPDPELIKALLLLLSVSTELKSASVASFRYGKEAGGESTGPPDSPALNIGR